MRGIEGEQVLLRIVLSESRTRDGQPLFRRVLELLRAEGLAGATVLKGIAGLGQRGDIHTVDIEVISQDLPIAIEAVDRPERIAGVLPKLGLLVSDGSVTLERARHATRPAHVAGVRE